MPAVFRRALRAEDGGRLVVTVLDECLAAYPPHEWERLEAQLRAMPAFSKPVKVLTRLLTSRAAECELDVQGRILVPAALREAAGLQQEAVVVGVLNRIEVWSPDAWSSFLRDSERLLDDAALDVQWPPPAGPPPAAPSRTGDLPHRPQAKPNR